MPSCICTFTWTDAVGHYDPVTKEWDPEAPVKHVRMNVDPECPMHPYWYLGEKVRLVEDLKDGWALFKHETGKVWKHWMIQCQTDRRY